MERVEGIEPSSSAWKAEVIATIQYPQIGPERRIRTFEGKTQQIYSLPSLTA